MAEAYGVTVSGIGDVLTRDLVISTLPAGVLQPLLSDKYPGVLLDATYSNREPAGHFQGFISGLEMLLWQAIGQQRLFQSNQLDKSLDN